MFLLAAGRERLQHTSGYQRIDGLLRLGKPFGCDAGRDEGNGGPSLSCRPPLRVLRRAKSRIPALVANPGMAIDPFQQTGHAGHHVVRDVPASRSRVGNELLLVERLGDVQRLCRGQVEVHVAVLLECRQVVEQRRLLQGFPALHLRDRRRRIGRERLR